MDRNYLFNTYDLRQVLVDHESKMRQKIEGLPEEKLQDADIEELIAQFEEEFKVHVPQLQEDKITIDQQETDIDVRHEFNRFISDRSKPFYVSGTKIMFYVPFEGDAELFKCQSSKLSFNPPLADIQGKEIIVTFTTTNYNAEDIKKQFNACLAQIKDLLIGTANDVEIFNASLRNKIENCINKRKDKLSQDKQLISDLGFPKRNQISGS